MSRFYGILAVMGWIFAAIVLLGALVVRYSRMQRRRTGFDVRFTDPNEKQP